MNQPEARKSFVQLTPPEMSFVGIIMVLHGLSAIVLAFLKLLFSYWFSSLNQCIKKYQVYTPNQPNNEQEVDEILDSESNSLNLGDPLNDFEIQVVGRFHDLFYNRFTDLKTFVSRMNTTLPDDEAVNQEVAIIVEEYGNLLRNNRTTILRLENWRNSTRADGPMIHAFYSEQEVSMMEAYRPGSSNVLNQLLLQGQQQREQKRKKQHQRHHRQQRNKTFKPKT